MSFFNEKSLNCHNILLESILYVVNYSSCINRRTVTGG